MWGSDLRGRVEHVVLVNGIASLYRELYSRLIGCMLAPTGVG